MNLYRKITRRTYTPEFAEKWGSKDYDSARPVWAESAETVRARHNPSMGTYWDDRFQDVLVSVEPMDVEVERERMLRADLSRVRCCDAAVLYPCVCSIAFTCAEHGQRCVGTHD